MGVLSQPGCGKPRQQAKQPDDCHQMQTAGARRKEGEKERKEKKNMLQVFISQVTLWVLPRASNPWKFQEKGCLPQNYGSSADSPTPSPATSPHTNSSVRTDSLRNQGNMLFLQGNLKPRGQIVSWYKCIDFTGARVIYFRVPLFTWCTQTTTTYTWYVHPPSCLPSIMSQKPHKNWVLQTLPSWASHGQEIRLSFLPGSWPSRSCLSLLKKS